MRRGFTLVEVAVALLVGAVLLGGGAVGVRYFTRAASGVELTADRVEALWRTAERLDRELAEARAVIYPVPGLPPSRFVFLRNFDGRIVVWYYQPTGRALRRAVLDHAGLATEDPRPALADLDGAYFTANRPGLVTYGLFTPGAPIVGAAKRGSF